MTVVLDASTTVALLVDGGPEGRWAEDLVMSHPVAAPHLMPVEVANVLRRAAMSGEISLDTAAVAHADLADLRVTLFPYAPFASRIWSLRANVTTYDAWYVALAESLEAPLATLDHRLTSAPGPRCAFVTLPG